ncbi:MAG: SBBP repeat-containing protein [Acidobacteriota bacterium]
MKNSMSVLCLTLVCLLAAFTLPPRAEMPAASSLASDRASLAQTYGSLPLSFIENRGQADSRVDYYAQSRSASLYFNSEGVTVTLLHRAPSLRPAAYDREPESSTERWTLKIDFVGARADARPEGRNRSSAQVSYFKGARSDWKTALPVYNEIVYKNLWPGIDLIYTGAEGRLKYTFILSPGADPDQIKLRYRGADSLRVDSNGELIAKTPFGDLRDQKPYSYQNADGAQKKVATVYDLKSDYEYGFRVSSYDRTRPLVIDPAVLVYCGYVGGTGFDEGFDIAVDSAGNAYVMGDTVSTETSFPVTVGPDTSFNGDTDVFVAKINASGTALIYCGYIGGARGDFGGGLALDSAGNVYVTGETLSDQTTFPVTVGPDLTFNGNVIDRDAFVAKVNAAGTALLYCGYIGGVSEDFGNGIAVDSSGNAYVTGTTLSSQTTFPVTVGPDLTINGFVIDRDAFVAKVNAAGTALLYCGYIGGNLPDRGDAIVVDSAGNAYVTGNTESTQTTFPVAVGPDLTHNSGSDAFIAKVNSTGASLAYCGYVGGAGEDMDFNGSVAVDSAGNAYITGDTESTQASFPVTVGPDLTFNGGDEDVFIAKVSATGANLVYCGYIGGTDDDFSGDVAVDSAGNAYIVGDTLSTESSFPVIQGPDLTHNGDCDVFVARVNAAGVALDFCGYIGGTGLDSGFFGGIALDSSNNVYVFGDTESAQATFPVAVGPDLTFNGGFGDAFVAKVTFQQEFDLRLDPASAASERGRTVKVRVNIDRFGGFTGAVTITPPSGSAIGVKVKPGGERTVTDPSKTFKLKIRASGVAGTHQLVFRGRSNSGVEVSRTFTLMIQ